MSIMKNPVSLIHYEAIRMVMCSAARWILEMAIYISLCSCISNEARTFISGREGAPSTLCYLNFSNGLVFSLMSYDPVENSACEVKEK